MRKKFSKSKKRGSKTDLLTVDVMASKSSRTHTQPQDLGHAGEEPQFKRGRTGTFECLLKESAPPAGFKKREKTIKKGGAPVEEREDWRVPTSVRGWRTLA